MYTFEEKMYDMCSWIKTVVLILAYVICLMIYVNSTKELGNLEGIIFFIKQPGNFVIALIFGFMAIALTIFSFISSLVTYNYSKKYAYEEKKKIILTDIIVAMVTLTLSIGFMQKYARLLIALIIIVGILWIFAKVKNN